MGSQVEISVRSSLSKVIVELSKIRDMAQETGTAFQDQAKGVTEGVRGNTKKAETFFANLRGVSRRVADQLRRDFKSLLSLNAITDSMKLSNQFRGAITETVELSDAIRRLGPIFGIASKDFVRFQSKLTQGLGEIGLGSDVAARTLLGLSETPVRGEENIQNYAEKSGMLASIGGEKGQEGNIAQQMARVIQARGGNVNDKDQQNGLAEDVRKAFNATGASPTKILDSMQALFAKMPEDFRKAITSSGLVNLAAASVVGGPNATKFIEGYLGQSKTQRLAFEARGGKGIFTDKGLDIKKFKTFFDSITGLIHGDKRLGAQTLGLGEDEAEGFIRLGENLDKVAEAQERIAKSTGDINQQYSDALSLGDAFRANLNRVKKELATPIATITQKMTDFFRDKSKSDRGSAVVAGGAAAVAAGLAGFGLSNIIGKSGFGKLMGGAGLGSLVKGAGAEAMLGENTIPVFVVNMPGGGIGGGAAGVPGVGAAPGSKLEKAAMITFAAAIGYAVGSVISDALDKNTQGVTKEGFHGDAGDQFLYKIARFFNQADAVDVEELGKQSEEERRDKSEKKKIKQGVSERDYGGNIEGGQPRKDPSAPKGTSKGNFGQVAPQRVEVKVIVESKDPTLKATASVPSRGAGYA